MKLSVRRDEFSLQLTHPNSKLFFVRVVNPDTLFGCVEVSDFRIAENDERLGYEALEYIWENFPNLFSLNQWRFKNIYPQLHDDTVGLNRDCVTKRFDEVTRLLRMFFEERGILMTNSFLDQSHGRFDSFYEIRKLVATHPK
ncbi:hypothetical protein [uncultured Ruegeria sp.]|uniref:hypothetical protein n=1 Tax=uncultured Ruegeria sp. TaxID=259304 RepID=UPI002609A9AB|nr:hypothetical protein [uncultured Ruegeria sp.]